MVCSELCATHELTVPLLVLVEPEKRTEVVRSRQDNTTKKKYNSILLRATKRW